MKLFEYQAKELFRKAGLATPRGVVVRRPEELERGLEQVGCPCVVKAQVLSGGRGKAGLIRICSTEKTAMESATRLLASSAGIPALLIEEAVDAARELYLSISVDPVMPGATLVSSPHGGVEIEHASAVSPGTIHKEPVDLTRGLMSFQARNLAYAMGLDGEEAKSGARAARLLFEIFADNDAELAEINPLFLSRDGRIIAGDAKVIIDDNALPRHPEHGPTREHFDSDVEFEAAQEGIPYLEFEGDIALMCAGAGLTTTVYDLVHDAGGTVASYLEFGGPNYHKAVRAMELSLKGRSRVILVVTFGTIARADVMAAGIVEAIHKLKPDRPIVACIRGTNEEEAVEILKQAGLEPLFDTEQAVKRAVKMSGRGGR